MKATVQRQVATKKGWPDQSHLFLAHLLQPGDRLGGAQIVERLVDTDGSVIYVLEDGQIMEYGPLRE